MIRNLLCLFLFLCTITICAQKKSTEFRSKKIEVVNDTIQLDSLSISNYKFKVFSSSKKIIPFEEYKIDFSNAQLIINKKKHSQITVEYYRYPDFITKTYSPLDPNLIVPNTNTVGKLYSATTNKKKNDINFFEGLKTQGFIARGITSGNNQNVVTNSSLDLTLEGKLSKNVSIRANIFDTNFPLQENGYSQNITDFDRIFIELFSKNWNVRAGDVSLSNQETYFLNYNKQVSGLQVNANIKDKTKVSASGAIVRGKFSSYSLTGTEGNQGPYKIFGTNNESAIIIISGSDKVFVNGMLLERGETKDYVIDYNLAEIQFNTTFPITNDMRIIIEFQYSDQSYNRFITYESASFKDDKFSIAGYFYNENDAKNQPLQQNLTTEQKQILADAGNDTSKMVSESAYVDEYSSTKIQYKKVLVGTLETFEYSTDENDELYFVTFTNVGSNQGSYIINSTIATGSIYEYVGENLGNYAPITTLTAPSSLLVAVGQFNYHPSEKTIINSELAFSDYDANLFSSIDDAENKRIATKLNWQQVLLNKKWQLTSDVNYKYIQDNFKTVQRFQNIEFNRDWNLVNPTGDQQQIGAGLLLENKNTGFISYQFNHLSFSDNFNGSKHVLQSELKANRTVFNFNGSLLNNTSLIEKDKFIRLKSSVVRSLGKPWAGVLIDIESNDKREINTTNYSTTSHRYKEYEGYLGVGDSAKVYAKFGFNYRENDSIKSNAFTQINNRKTFYVTSKLIQNKNTNLSLYANYRLTKNWFADDEKSLNSKLVYNQRFFKNFISLGTTYESSSGNIAQQDFIYVETEVGQGYYTWVDYNNDGIQNFDEFEIAQFQDQANYLRVALPNLTYLQTQKVKFKQSITLNPLQWNVKKGVKKTLSHFYNQTYLSVDNEQERVGNKFNLNPFVSNDEKQLGLSFNFRNNLYFNRNLQKYSLIYTYGSSTNKQQFGIGSQENSSLIQQLELVHKLSDYWLINIKTSLAENKLETENFTNRNYNLTIKEVIPKLSFLYNKDHKLSLFYQFKQKENFLADFEELKQQKLGLEYFFISKKRNQISADFTLFLNDFNGNENTPVSYQMLEGLTPGKNYTWNLLLNQKINATLNLNLSYLGRKSEESSTIHTGMIQLKAIF